MHRTLLVDEERREEIDDGKEAAAEQEEEDPAPRASDNKLCTPRIICLGCDVYGLGQGLLQSKVWILRSPFS